MEKGDVVWRRGHLSFTRHRPHTSVRARSVCRLKGLPLSVDPTLESRWWVTDTEPRSVGRDDSESEGETLLPQYYLRRSDLVLLGSYPSTDMSWTVVRTVYHGAFVQDDNDTSVWVGTVPTTVSSTRWGCGCWFRTCKNRSEPPRWKTEYLTTTLSRSSLYLVTRVPQHIRCGPNDSHGPRSLDRSTRGQVTTYCFGHVDRHLYV